MTSRPRGVGLFTAAVLAGAALASSGCETVDLGTPPADVNACRPSQTYFVKEIWPNFLAVDYGGRHCYDASCHGAASTNSLRLMDNIPPGLDALGNVAVPIPLTMGWEANYRSTAEQMNCANVASSKLLTLPSGQRTHGGGKLIEPAGTEAGLIQAWVGEPPP